MPRAFTKGQLVTLFTSWDGKGTVAYRHAIVHSCGTKRMVLTDAESGEEIGRAFPPVVGSQDAVLGFYGETFPRMTDREAEVVALQLGATLVAYRRAMIESQIERSLQGPAFQYDDEYRSALTQKLAVLHEPRVIAYPDPFK
jgi:hypothetical protein